MSPNDGGGGDYGGLSLFVTTCSQWLQLVAWTPNKLWKSNSIFNLWLKGTGMRFPSLPKPCPHTRKIMKLARLECSFFHLYILRNRETNATPSRLWKLIISKLCLSSAVWSWGVRVRVRAGKHRYSGANKSLIMSVYRHEPPPLYGKKKKTCTLLGLFGSAERYLTEKQVADKSVSYSIIF